MRSFRPDSTNSRARRDEAGQVVHLHVLQQPGHVVVRAVRDAHDAVAEGVEVRADDGDLHALVHCRGEQRRRATTGRAERRDALRVHLGTRGEVVDRPHRVPRAPTSHRLAEQHCRARGGTAGLDLRAGAPSRIVAPGAEGELLDRECRIAVLDALERVLLRVAHVPLGARIPVVVEAKDVGKTATVAGDTDDRREWARARLREQQITDRAQVRARVEDDLLARVAAEVLDSSTSAFNGARVAGNPPSRSIRRFRARRCQRRALAASVAERLSAGRSASYSERQNSLLSRCRVASAASDCARAGRDGALAGVGSAHGRGGESLVVAITPATVLRLMNSRRPISSVISSFLAQGSPRSRSALTVHRACGKPGASRVGAPSQPAAIIAVALNSPPLPGR